MVIQKCLRREFTSKLYDGWGDAHGEINNDCEWLIILKAHNWVPVLIHSQTWHIGGYSDEALNCSKVLTLNREARSLLTSNNKVKSKNGSQTKQHQVWASWTCQRRGPRATQGTRTSVRRTEESRPMCWKHLATSEHRRLAAGWASRKIFLSCNARPSLPFSDLKKTKKKKKTSSSLCAVPFATHKVLVLSLVKYLD